MVFSFFGIIRVPVIFTPVFTATFRCFVSLKETVHAEFVLPGLGPSFVIGKATLGGPVFLAAEGTSLFSWNFCIFIVGSGWF